MTAHELLAQLYEGGARVYLENDRVRISAPPNTLSEVTWSELRAHKAEIRDLLSRLSPDERRARPLLARQQRPRRLPLSYAQQRLWFIDQIEGASAEYNVPEALRLKGELDRGALERTINAIVERHESLRTHFGEVDGEPEQVIEPTVRIEIPVEDLSGLEEARQRDQVLSAMRREAGEPFDLGRGPVLRMRLLKLGEQDHVLLRTMHHIVSDGWSQGVFNREFMVLYEAYREGRENPLKPLEVQYADFALWQRGWLDGGAMDEGLAYWKEELAGIPERLELPLDRPRPAVQTFAAESCQASLAGEQVEGLKRLSRESQATLYMTMLSAFGVLLSRYSGQDDVVVGSLIANRQEAQLEEMIGFFVNSLVMRVRVNPEMSFRELLEQVRRTTLEAYQHQDIPFERLVEELSPQRSLNTTPVFQVSFALQNAPWAAQRMKGLEVEPVSGDELRVRFDLEVHVWEREGRIAIRWLYNRDLFERWRMEQMARHYVRLLEAMVADADEAVGRVDLLGTEERQQILEEWNDTERGVPEATLPTLFEEQVERTPEAIAVVFEEESLSYAELNRKANQLAHYLIGKGVGPEDVVALAVPRSMEMIVSLLGILKAGAAYLPLDPEYPAARLAFMLEDAGAKLIITVREMGHVGSFTKLFLDDVETEAALQRAPRMNPWGQVRGPLRKENLAYVMYTSGSMGMPKGIQVTQKAIERLVINSDYVKVNPADRIAQLANASFDAATFEIWGALLNGASIVIFPKETALDAMELKHAITRKQVSIIFLTTALFNRMVHEQGGVFQGLRYVLFGGERAEPQWVWRILDGSCPEVLLHMYGPTETTTFASWFELQKNTERIPTIPIGRPISNTRVYVLDRRLEPAPIGVGGELYIAGAGLARGYLKRAGLTAERFVADPYGKPGTRMYRTGDVARWRADGNLEFLGRADQQVKIRGFRIELGEIEAALRENPEVRDAVVMAREDRPGEKRLVGYVLAAVGQEVDTSVARQKLRESLPDYMVPAAIMVLPSWPLTPNGKLDRKGLPEPEFISGAGYRAPRTPEEEVLCGLFAEVLGLERVGIDDDFFALGGHSLMATRLVSRVRATLGVELSIRALFELPNVGQLSAQLRGAGKGRTPLVSQQRPRRLPLSYAQQRLWFIDQIEGASAEYNMPEALRLKGELDRGALERTINAIVERHESLRTHFGEVDGEPEQVIEPTVRIEIPVEDLSGLEEARQRDQVLSAMRREAGEPFDLGRGPVLRMRLLKLGEQDHVLLRTMHHIVSDGWSQGVFNREFMVLYEAYREGRENPLKPLEVQYADFALWQRGWLDGGAMDEGLAYWKEELAGIPERLELPLDRPRPAVQTFAAESCQASLAGEQVEGLKRLSRESQATLYMTMLSAFGVLLSRYSGQDDVVVGSPIANRQEAQLEEMIGFFVNSLVMRVRVNPEMSFRELLEQVRRTTLEAYQHQDIPFERLVEELSPQRSLNTTPVFQVSFALQNAPWAAQRMKGLEVEPVSGDELRVRFDLEVHVWEREGRIAIRWLYNRDLFERWRMEQMARHYVRLLEAMVADADEAVGRVDLLGTEERQQILEEWNDTERGVPEATLPTLFEEQVERTPEAIAVVFEEESLSYAELNRKANQLAHYLIGKGVGPEDVVALAVPRSMEMIVSLLGILKAGAAYLPLDPEYPAARLAFMLEDAAPACVLTTSEDARTLPEHPQYFFWNDPEMIQALALEPTSNPTDRHRIRPLSPQHSAYVIYTSGSTGTPKGVIVTHQNVVRLFGATQKWFHFGPDDVWTLFHSYAFDFSVWEIWGALLHGGRLIGISYLISRSPAQFLKLLAYEGVTVLNQTPSAFYQLIQADREDPNAGRMLALRYVIFGGEALDFWRLKEWYQHHTPNAPVLINMYGITETTVHVSYVVIKERAIVITDNSLIGRSLPDLRVYVLDRRLEPAPIGVGGELYIAGAGLARGYLKRAGLTAERFVADPYGKPGTRMYRTGDVARWRADGNLEFLGRADQQVKIRGFRIELGEIEAALRSHESVQDAVVRVQGEGEEKRLLGYAIRQQSEAEQFEAQATYIREWQQLYDSVYGHGDGWPGDFNIAGWESSYTGEPIAAEEMRIWVEETVARVRALEPSRVLEIGCGTGLLLTRLAPNCESYLGLDFSEKVLEGLRAHLRERQGMGHVQLRQGLAHEISFISDDSVDLVILNSVVQYFPDIDYLLNVLAEAVRVTRPGGHIFVGDVRSLPLLEAYHTSVQVYKASKKMLIADLRPRIRQALWKEEELAIDFRLFEELGRCRKKLGRVEGWLKAGAYDNELSRFRYDVTMRVGDREELIAPEQWVSWDEGGGWREAVKQGLTQAAGGAVGVRGIRDGRVRSSVEAARLLTSEENKAANAGQLWAACAEVTGEDPDAVAQLAQQLGVSFCWQGFGAEGLYEAVFNPRWRSAERQEEAPHSYRRYGNTPSRSIRDGELGRILQHYLRESLPDYMVPAAIMVLPSWPLTPNGKLDRKGLPEPEFISGAGYRAPRTPEEEVLCGLFAEVLGLERVGIDDDFFALGGHSLMATRLVSRVRATLGVELSIRALFELPNVGQLSAQLRGAGKGRTPLVSQQRPRRLPLSYAQQRLWFIDQIEGASAEYNMPEALRLKGELDRGALERTINAIVERHESLRTHFGEVDGEPEQVIEPTVRIEIPVEDLSGLEEARQRDQVLSAMRREAGEPFDLGRGPVLRMRLLKLGEQDHVLLRTMHHIVSDGWSQGVFNREFMVLYEAYREGRENPLKPLEVQYADFALWQRGWLDGGAMDEGLAYWKEELAGIPERLELPLDRPRPAVQTFAAESCQASLAGEQVEGLKRLSRESQATLYMTMLSAFGVLLSRYSGQDDVVVGSPIANRQEAQLEEMIGFFVNSLVMRVRVNPEMSFRELLEQVRRTTLEAYQHQDIPFERLVEELSPQRSLNTTPVFQVSFALQNAPWAAQRMKGLEVEPVSGDELRVRFDLEVHVWEREGRIAIRWLYNRDLFERWRMEQMARHYVRLLEAMVADADEAVGRVDLLGTEERQQILEEWNDTERGVPEATLPTLFEEQVERTPEAIAVVFEEESLSYAELNRKANQLAHYLIGKGVGPEDVVALAVPRSMEMIVSLLGILKAGAAYLPLDPEYPAARLAFMLEDAAPACVLTTSEDARTLPEHPQYFFWNDPEMIQALALEPTSNPTDRHRIRPLSPQHSAYVIYTSGSTGTPKGVIVAHRELSNYITWASRLYEAECGLGTPINTPLAFDATISSLFLPLIAGQRIILLPEEREIEALATLLGSGTELTLVKLTPAHLSALEGLLGSNASSIQARRFVVGGEALNESVTHFWRDHVPALRMVNEYGPTETVVGCCIYTLESQPSVVRDVPIGKPTPNTRVYVLDRRLEPAPIGVGGELYIAGAGLARGYLKRAGLTAERFVADPYGKSGTRMYRTGDVARWRADGNLEFLGRADQQVKIRGFRIELGEIEAALRENPEVRDAVVMAREDRPGEKRLVGYVLAAVGQEVDTSVARQKLRESLPDYMVPAAIMVLPSWPLTPNGKLDRKGLPEPEFISAAGYRAPRTPEEEILCGLFAEVLGLERVGINDNFFDLGGDSLASIRVVSRARRLNVRMAPRDIFLHRTIKDLAAAGERTSGANLNKLNDLEKEATLDPAITVGTGDWNWQAPANVLLTGASGFLGAFLLADILKHTDALVHCLIRSSSPEHGLARIQKRMRSLGLWDRIEHHRILPVPGDLSQPRLGVSPRRLERLAEEVDVIYHNAAIVNTIYSYEILKPVNVLGTHEILRLACSHRMKPVHFVSTMSILSPILTEGNAVLTEEQRLKAWYTLPTGYAQSKWVAESLVKTAGSRGIPVAVYRPSFIAGSTGTGACNSEDFLSRFIDGCLRLARVPDLEMEINMLPVDYVSRALVKLSKRQEVLGRTMNLINPHPTFLSEISKCLQSSAHPMEMISYEEWRSRCDSHGSLTALLAFFPEPAESQKSKIESRSPWDGISFYDTQNLLEADGILFPNITLPLLNSYVAYAERALGS